MQLKNNLFVFKSIVFLTYLSLVLILLSLGIQYFPDSSSYINASILRASCYPLFLDIIEILFSRQFDVAVLVIQLFLGLYSTFYFVKTINNLFLTDKSLKQRPRYFSFNEYLCRNLKDKWVLFALSLIVMSPYYLILKIGNAILSEALAYPLFIFFMSHLFKGFFLENKKNLYFSTIIAFILVLTRVQFLFVIPVCILLCTYLLIKTKLFKEYFLLLIIFVSIPLLADITDKFYHKFYNDSFNKTISTGIWISAIPFFVADEQDYELFSKKEDQDYFKYVYAGLKKDKVTLKNRKDEYGRGYKFYAWNTNKITLDNIADRGTEFFKNKNFTEEEALLLNEKTALRIFLPLIKDNFIDWAKIYGMNVIAGIGFKKFFFLFPIFICFAFFQI